MVRTKRCRKRQRAVSPGSIGDGQTLSEDSGAFCNNQDEKAKAELLTTFDRFEDVLCELLSVASVIDDVEGVLGEHRGRFVLALNRMVDAGDIPWVCEVDSGVGGSGNEMEIEEARVSFSSQMDIDEEEVSTSEAEVEEGEIVPSNQPGIDGAEIIPVRQMQKRVKDTRTVRGRGKVTLQQLVNAPIPVARVQGDWPPPLPLIQDEALRRQALTPEVPGNARNPVAHYQRLEWLGDAYMEVLISRILFDRFPKDREGPLTKMRQPLLTNKLFSNFAALYNFETMITGYRALEPKNSGSQAGISWKILADCFEAYVAAVALSDPAQGFATLIQWLSALYEPVFKDAGNRDGYLYGKGDGFLVLSRLRKGEFRRMKNPPNAKTTAAERITLRRSKRVAALNSRTHRRQSLPPPPDNRYSRRRLIQYETGPPIIIEDSDPEAEDEADWEEVEIADKENQNSAGIPIDPTAIHRLDTLVAGKDVSIEYVRVDELGSSGGIDAMQGVGNDQDEWRVTVKLTGWGCVNRPIGSGWGTNEADASLRAAMNILMDKAFCSELALRRFREYKSESHPKKNAGKASTAPAFSVIPASWKEIDGVIVIDDD